MAVELALLPVQFIEPDWGFSHGLLPVGAPEHRFINRLRDMALTYSHPVPEGFSHYLGSGGYGVDPVDAYGQPIYILPADELYRFFKRHARTHTYPAYQGAMAYLGAMGKMPIGLYWY